MPGARAQRSATSTTTQPELIDLMLPSAMTERSRGLGCVQGLAEKEGRLRLAQADDALRELRRQLRVSAQIIDFKKNTVGGTSQRMATKARTLMLRFHDKTHRCARRYTAAYTALCALKPPGDWQARLRPLDHSKDLQLPGRDKEKDETKAERESEGRREISWIWLAPRREGDRDVATGDEYGIGAMLRSHCRLLTDQIDVQLCASNGRRCELGHIAGQRRYAYLLRRCVASWFIVTGGHVGG